LRPGWRADGGSGDEEDEDEELRARHPAVCSLLAPVPLPLVSCEL
jgi:hypothetical protein